MSGLVGREVRRESERKIIFSVIKRPVFDSLSFVWRNQQSIRYISIQFGRLRPIGGARQLIETKMATSS